MTAPASEYWFYGLKFGLQGRVGAIDYAFKYAQNRPSILRYEIREGDRRNVDSSLTDRVESVAIRKVVYGEALSFSYELMVEDDGEINDWVVVTQIHTDPSKSPPFSIEITGGRLSVWRRSSDDLFEGSGNGVPYLVCDAGNIVRGKWYKIQAQVALGLTGWCSVYIDEYLAGEYSGNIGYAPVDGEFKMGIYRKASGSTLSVQFKDLQLFA